MNFVLRLLSLSLATWLFWGAPAASAHNLKVVVSIAPIHALIAGIMDRVAIPELLIRADHSPYDYRLRARQTDALAEADLIVWVGAGPDAFLEDTISALPAGKRVIRLLDLDLPVRLSVRSGRLWPDGRQDAEDPYIWLDSDNAVAIVEAITRALIELDRLHKIDFGRSKETVVARLGGLDRQLRRAFDRHRGTPYLVDMDVYQYLESRYGLEAAGALRARPDATPAAEHAALLIEEIEAADIRCLFALPQVEEDSRAAPDIDGQIRRVGLDIFDGGRARGVNAYFEMMRNLPKSIADCLGP